MRPESLSQYPSSDTSGTSEEDNPNAQGLTLAAQTLSEGATMYLQSMKTFAIMFTVLSFINIPVFYIYQSSTKHNNLGSLEHAFKYYTIGNLGQTDNVCQHSDIDLDNLQHRMPPLQLKCPKG